MADMAGLVAGLDPSRGNDHWTVTRFLPFGAMVATASHVDVETLSPNTATQQVFPRKSGEEIVSSPKYSRMVLIQIKAAL